ncbi:ABC transporter permease [Nonomuraea sp. B5E05]|uniref:ABC transporter permease n=1 Tax=Nonomuraea sp. B5E05 TaxID=3153569 RepID=UPI0032613FFC
MSLRSTAFLLLKRLVAACLLLAVISLAVFSLVYLSPGSAEQILAGGKGSISPEQLQRLRAEHHLDEPLLTQYWIWVKDAVTLDFGQSIQTALPVTDELGARLRVSLFLGGYAFVLTTVAGVLLGLFAALRRNSILDRAIVASTLVGLSAPAFATALLLLYAFAILVPVFPAFGQGTDFLDTLWHLTLPALALATSSTAFLVKHTRAAMLGVLDQDHVVFARARGLSITTVLCRYVGRNALIPITTISALTFIQFVVGAVLVEIAFSLQGIGSLLVQAVAAKDVPMVQGVVMLVAVIVIGANLVADLFSIAVDPRVRLGRRAA